MAKDIAIKNQSTAVAPVSDRNWAEEYGDEAFQSNIIGTLLKFAKGEWLAGKEMEELPIGTELVAAAHLLQSGWIRWEENKPVEVLMGCRADGFRPAEREELGYTDKSQWQPNETGQIMDPWQRTDTLYLANPATGEVYTYSTGSEGGKQAIKGLMREYGPHLRTHPNEIPTIKLGSEWYLHTNKQFGKVYKPVLELVPDGWRDAEDVSFEVAEEEEEKPKAAPKKAAAKPALKVVPPAKKRTRY